MSESYVLDIKNIEYFIYSMKLSISEVVSVKYEPDVKTVEVYGTFTEQVKTQLDSFIESYTNPEKVSISNTRILYATQVMCEISSDWFTMFNWTEHLSLKKVILSIKLEPSSLDSTYNETFRYGVRLVDIKNNLLIKEVEYYNSTYEEKEIIVDNFTLSLGNVDIELQVKKYNKGSAVYIKKASAEYV